MPQPRDEVWTHQRGQGPLLWCAWCTWGEAWAAIRRFFHHALIGITALPTWAPGAGVSCCSYLGSPRQVQTYCGHRCLQESCEQAQYTAYIFPAACSVCHCWGSIGLGTTSLEEHTACPRLLQLPASLYSYKHPCTSQLWLSYSSLSLATVTKYTEIMLLSSGGGTTKGEKKKSGILSMQPQKQQIKSHNWLGNPYICGISK